MKVNGLYLGEILNRDEVKYTSNNLIIAPTGCGKTHFIMNTLASKYVGRKLMLVSTTSLKDSFENEVGTFTTQDIRRGHMNITDKDLYIMTYSEFGNKIKWEDDFINDYTVIFCDEVHSLIDYYLTHRTNTMFIAIRTLFKKLKDINIFYFTATTDKIDKFIDKEYGNLYRDVNVIDYSNNKDIRQYINITEIKFNSVDGIESVIDSLGKINIANIKGIIFNERIDGMGRIEDLLHKKGYKSISIWSVNNESNVMSEEQLRVREMLLTTGMFPDEYDFVIINGAMREGWNLLDNRVEIAIMNTTDETDIVQARGRVRKDISLLAVRVNEDIQPIDIRIMEREKSLNVIEKYLGKEIDKNDKDKISELLNIRRENDSNLVKWDTISKALLSNGYEIENKVKRVEGKQVRVSIITMKDIDRKSTDTRSSIFLNNLDKVGFTRANQVNLDKYMKKGKNVAFSHIKSSYSRLVLNGDWSERKFADVTYMIAKNNELYIKDIYDKIGNDYDINLSEVSILSVRSRYESSALRQLEQAKIEENKRDLEAQRELLEYVKLNSR